MSIRVPHHPQPLATALGGGFGARWRSSTLRLRVTPPDGLVTALAFHPGRAALVSAFVDGRVLEWPLQGDSTPRLLYRHAGEVWALAFDSGGEYLASGCSVGEVQCWRRSARRHTWNAHEGMVNGLAFHPTTGLLASAGADCKVQLWQPETGARARQLRLSDEAGQALAFSPDGRWLAVATDHFSTWIFGHQSTRPHLTLKGGGLVCAFSQDGQTLAVDDGHGAVLLYDTATFALRHTLFEAGGAALNGVVFSRDGSRLASASSGTFAQVREVSTGIRVHALIETPVRSLCLALSPDGRHLAIGGGQASVTLLNEHNGKVLVRLHAWPEGSWAAVSPACRFDASAAAETHLYGVFDGHSVPLERMRKHCRTPGLLSLALTPDARAIAAPRGAHARRITGSRSESMKGWLETPAPDAAGPILAELVVRTKPTHHPSCLAFSPDGTLLACGSKDMNIDLWSVGSAREVRSLRGHMHEVTSLAFAPDGKRLASGSRDGTARLWDIERGTTLATFPSGQSGLPLTVSFCADTGLLLCASDDNTITTWDLSSSQVLHAARLPYRFADRRALHEPLQRLAQCHSHGSVAVWDLAQGMQLWDAKFHDDTPGALAFSPNGRVLAVGLATTQGTVFIGGSGKEPPPPDLRDFAILLVDVASGKKLRELRGHTDNVSAVTFDAGGVRLLSAAADHSLRLWSVTSGRQLSMAKTDSFNAAVLAVAPDGATLASGERTGEFVGRIGLWDGQLTERRVELARHIGDMNPVVFSRDGRWLVSAGEDGRVNLWPLDLAQGPRVLAGHTQRVFSLALSPDGTVLASAAWDGLVRLWRFPDGQPLAQYERDPQDEVDVDNHQATVLHPGEPSRRALHSLAFSADGRHLICAGHSARIDILRVPHATLVRRFGDGAKAQVRNATHDGDDENRFSFDIFALAYSPDGQHLASGCTDNSIKLRKAATARVILTLAGHTSPVYRLVFSPDSLLLASGSVDQTVRLWDVRSGRQLHCLTGHTVPGLIEKGTSVEFSPNGQILASGGTDGTMRLWNVGDGRCLSVNQGHSGAIASVRFSPDGYHLACGSNDAAATLWDVRDSVQPRKLASLFAFTNGGWAVVDADGRFDASNGGEIEWLHWAVGLETVGLDQLKDRYYEPGLLPKLLSRETEPLRDVAQFGEVALHPRLERVALGSDGLRSRLCMTDQGGGIGRIEVFVNGKEMRLPDIEMLTATRDGKRWLDLDLTGHPQLVPDVDNLCEVRAYNVQGYLVSRRLGWQVRGKAAPAAAPEFWAIVIGVSHYEGPSLDLHFAAKDATDIARALSLAAQRLFGPDHVHIHLLASEYGVTDKNAQPTRANILAALQDLTRAKSTDVLMLYMAGHGTSSPGNDGDYLFLTSDARSTRFEDPALRAVSTISAAELSDCVRSSPVLKQVLVLDTCAAGAVVGWLQAQRAVPSSQVRALERLKDRTGLHILAGSAADAVSYESSRFGQGLLTYSLLLGMRGAALQDDGMVDVSRLFSFAADTVPELARDLGGIQRPHIATPRAGQSFPIGSLTPEDRQAIPLANPKPLVLRTSFANARSWNDEVGLGRVVNEELRRCAERGRDAPFIFVDVAEGELPGAVFVAGRYEIEGDKLSVEVRGTRDGHLLGSITLEANVQDATGLGQAIVASLQRLIHSASGSD